MSYDLAYLPPMKQAMLTFKLSPDLRDAVVLLAVQRRVSMSHVVREALYVHYGIVEPRQALAEALATRWPAARNLAVLWPPQAILEAPHDW